MNVDIRGQRFGWLEAVEPTEKRLNGSVLWCCKCACGGEKFATVGYLRRGWTTSCGCKRRQHHQFGDPKSPEYRLLCSAKQRAKASNLAFNLTVNDINIPQTCPLLGIPIFRNKGKVGPNSPSIDRIVPADGYTRENVWVISHKANSIKSNYTLEEFRTIVIGWETKLSCSKKTNRLVYLASPYTHLDKKIEARRYEAALAAWVWLIKNQPDLNFYSPITQSHSLCVYAGTPGDWKFWARFDETMISKCCEFWVLCLEGFSKSVGIAAEREIAGHLGLPIRFLVPTSIGYDIVVEEPTEGGQ